QQVPDQGEVIGPNCQQSGAPRAAEDAELPHNPRMGNLHGFRTLADRGPVANPPVGADEQTPSQKVGFKNGAVAKTSERSELHGRRRGVDRLHQPALSSRIDDERVWPTEDVAEWTDLRRRADDPAGLERPGAELAVGGERPATRGPRTAGRSQEDAR